MTMGEETAEAMVRPVTTASRDPPKPTRRPTSAMISPKPVAIAVIVAVKPTPGARPGWREPRISESTASAVALTMNTVMRAVAVAVWRRFMACAWRDGE